MARTRSLGRSSGKDILLHDEDGRQWVETRQDTEPVAKAAEMLRAKKPDKDFTLVAMIPAVTLDQSINEGWFHDEKAWTRWYEENPQYHTTDKYRTI